jgi:hypothetical protein
MNTISRNTLTIDVSSRVVQGKKTHYYCFSEFYVKSLLIRKTPLQVPPELGDMPDDLLKFMTYSG